MEKPIVSCRGCKFYIDNICTYPTLIAFEDYRFFSDRSIYGCKKGRRE